MKPFLKEIFPLVFLVGPLLVSCHQKEKGKVITERIQYDVNIKTPDPEYDWWVQNIEGTKRDDFVKKIIQAAYEGKVKAYDPFHQLLTVEQIKAIGNRTDTVATESPDPPYNDTTIIIKETLNLQDITRVRFLEEWRMEENSLKMEKKIIGLAPVLAVHETTDSIRGYMPLFWIYFQSDYPGIFSPENKKQD